MISPSTSKLLILCIIFFYLLPNTSSSNPSSLTLTIITPSNATTYPTIIENAAHCLTSSGNFPTSRQDLDIVEFASLNEGNDDEANDDDDGATTVFVFAEIAYGEIVTELCKIDSQSSASFLEVATAADVNATGKLISNSNVSQNSRIDEQRGANDRNEERTTETKSEATITIAR